MFANLTPAFGYVDPVPDSETVYRIGLLFTLGTLVSKHFLLRNSTAPLLKVERSVSDRFLKRSESSLNIFIGAEIATESRFGK